MYCIKDTSLSLVKSESNASASHLEKWAPFVAWQFSPFTPFRNANNCHVPFEKNRTVCHLGLNTSECTCQVSAGLLVHQKK